MNSELPILFKGELVRAILDGCKTQTRRLWTLRATHVRTGAAFRYNDTNSDISAIDAEIATGELRIPRFGRVGDRLWVKETWAVDAALDELAPRELPQPLLVYYHADGEPDDEPDAGKWRPSMFMPRWASRLTLECTAMRVERLQDITEEDAKAEGIQRNALGTHWCGAPHKAHGMPRQFNSATEAFRDLWDHINGHRQGARWSDNPPVLTITFRRIEP